MNIQVVGLNHKSAPIEIRERISFSAKKLFDALVSLKRCPPIEEGLILSTCNRVEIYTVCIDARKGFQLAQEFLSDFHKINPAFFKEHLYLFNDAPAIRHLFRVVSSLDSMVVGETQIFGQVKQAYFKAREAQAAGKILSCVFEEAIKVGKLVRSETKIGRGAVSISSAAITLAKKIFGNLDDKKVLIIGAGKIAELAVKDLYSQGIKTVLVANRTFEKARELARLFRGLAIRLEKIADYARDADILISSTSAPHFLVEYRQVLELMRQRNHRPIFLIDLGLPRNISPEVNEVENVHLYNIDDLAGVCDANLKERLREAQKAERIIDSRLELVSQELLRFKTKTIPPVPALV